MAQSKIVIGYWGIKGRAQAIRDFAEYLQIPYENKIYTDGAEWFGKDKIEQEKTSPFVNLPYILDGDKLVNESDALFHYLAVKAGKRELVSPNDGKDLVLLSQLRGVMIDLIGDMMKAAGCADEAAGLELFNKNGVPRLGRLSKHLGANNYFVNNKITYLDFGFYELFKAVESQDSSFIADNLKAFIANFESIPQIKAYQSSDRMIHAPFVPPTYKVFNK